MTDAIRLPQAESEACEADGRSLKQRLARLIIIFLHKNGYKNRSFYYLWLCARQPYHEAFLLNSDEKMPVTAHENQGLSAPLG